MFADVSGFTKMAEAMARYGPEGAEHLAFHLNQYFSIMVRIIGSRGGDIFKVRGTDREGDGQLGRQAWRQTDRLTEAVAAARG